MIKDPDLVTDRCREATFDELVAAYRELSRLEQVKLVKRLMWLETGWKRSKRLNASLMTSS